MVPLPSFKTRTSRNTTNPQVFVVGPDRLEVLKGDILPLFSVPHIHSPVQQTLSPSSRLNL